jgi:hypothetical protein
MPQPPFSPREFLKNRRPEKFSDSVSQNVPILDRSLLEYHLETLTARSQEHDFENFARRLAEHEICPNLLPHTGPTGGGDSKVDAETYPVADSLSLLWHTGIGRAAAGERWAFAFSAKKKWRPKVESDVAKIVSTNRGYKKAFFITNQFVADKLRAEVEDQLRKQHGIDLRILDRTWILDRVFSSKREALSIDELKIQTEVRLQRKIGPQDLQNEQELQEIEKRIEGEKGRDRTPILVDDCLRAVEVARSLELPRTEVEGRLLRLTSVAEECGTPHQRFRAEYTWAWTGFWWFEDYDVLLDHYEKAEGRAKGTTNVYELELLFNLWCNLQMAVRSANVSTEGAKLDNRTSTLVSELRRFTEEKEKPSSALQAETLLLMIELISSTPQQPDDWLRNAAKVVERAAGLVGFPFEPLVQILTELGKILGDRTGYSDLHDKLVEVVAARKGEAAAARLLVQRAAQALDDEQPYVAIEAGGKAIARLYKHETRNELVEALYVLGNAYDRVGLIWAARGTVLTGASVALNEFWTYDQITIEQAMCFNRIRWFELRLGRLPHCLAWHETTQAALAVLRHQGLDMRRSLEQLIRFDTCLAILILKADLRQLHQLSRLPQTLNVLELNLSAGALRFALGHECELPEGLRVDKREQPTFFKQLRKQPAADQLPIRPLLYNERRITLTSRVLGCSIVINADNRSPATELAETVIAALEALLATGVKHRFFAHEPDLTINIRVSDFAVYPFRFSFDDESGRPLVEITTAEFHPHKLAQAQQHELHDKLTELLLNIIGRFFTVDLSEKRLKDFFGDELALERAVNFTGSFVSLGNVLGHSPKTTLDAWINIDHQDYAVQRTEDWDAEDRGVPTDGTRIEREGSPDSADEWTRRPGHDEMETVSLIRLPLWDKANWTGMAYLWEGTDQAPPAIGFAFTDRDAGREIFAQWQNEIGKVDATERLRLTIIQGITRKNAHAYTAVISANPELPDTSRKSKYFFMVSRMLRMDPSSDTNLREFLARFRQTQCYLLVPAWSRGADHPPELFFERGILKRDLQIREAWQVGPNDPDAIALRDDAEPIIPDGEHDPPFLGALKWLREMKQDLPETD